MYFSQLVIDNVVQPVPEIFNFNGAQAEQYKKQTSLDNVLDEGGFPVEPVLWPNGAANPTVRGFRGNGAIALVEGNGDGLMVPLGTGVPFDSFMERKLLQGTQQVKAQSGTVMSDLGARCLWPNVADNVRAPSFGQSSEAAESAAMSIFVKEGRHVEGVAARVLALALEHALVPFTMRTRVRNANACYWHTGKYRSDNITYSLQNVQAIDAWASPGGVGQEHDPTVVVWVGDATKVRGMALLSRIMDQGGPIYLQEAHLCKQFDAGRLLMVGTGTLHRDLRPVEPSDLEDAIDEALWLLMTYNGLTVAFVRNALRLLIRNLPVVDRAQYDEAEAVWWQVRQGMHGPPVLDPVRTAQLEREVVAAFGASALDACGADTAEKRLGFFSDLFRNQIHAPGPGMNGLAPPEDVVVGWAPAALLVALQQHPAGQAAGQNVHFAAFDVAAPPVLPNVPPQRHVDLRELYGAFSGRYGYHVFGYSQPPAAGEVVPVPPPGWQVAAVDPGYGAPPGLAPDGVWMEWLGGNDAAGVPLVMANEMREYRVRLWVPAADSAYNHAYVRPPAYLRRFRLSDNFQLAVRMNGAWPDLAGESRALQDYVDANSRGGDPLSYLDGDAPANLRGLTLGQRSLAVIIGVSYMWDAHHVGRTQNDAYGRWVRARFAGERLTTVPDELKLYLGGVRSRRYVEANGGLWTLCYQQSVVSTRVSAGHEASLEILKDRSQLAAYMLKLRCAVEMADVMANVSNSRVVGCAEPAPWPISVEDRLMRGRVDHMTVVDGASYLALQALLLTAVFDHPDAVVARTFDVVACSTLRLREARRGVVFTDESLQHMNWLSPQVLSVNTWTTYFGVAAPSFIPNRVGQSWLRDARFTTAWNDVASHFEPGVFLDRMDEIWSAILTGHVASGWFPVTLVLAQFGTGLQVDVSRVRMRNVERYVPVQARLRLPYETRIGRMFVNLPDADDMLRPVLPCDGTGGFVNGGQLPHVDVQVTPQGHVGGVMVPVGCSVIDPHNTSYGSEGVTFGRYSPSLVLGMYTETNRSTGQFWINTVRTEKTVAAGMSAGGQRLLKLLMPVEPVPANESGGGRLVETAAVMAMNKPNVAVQANPGTGDERNIGNVPLHEVELQDAMSVVSGLTGLSEEQRNLLLAALAKNTAIRQAGSVASMAGTGTEGGAPGQVTKHDRSGDTVTTHLEETIDQDEAGR
jgi:hypothetical protein